MRLGALATAMALVTWPCLADCPIELSVYGGRDDAATLDFHPAQGAAVTNSFRLVHGETILDGIVMWSQGVERPNGVISYQCPDGDVTGPEYEACTVWQGVIYAVDASGEIGLLPRAGEAAPARLLFPDLAYAVHAFPAFVEGVAPLSSEVFTLSGCQE